MWRPIAGVFASDQVLEVRCVSGVVRVAQKDRHPDEWDRPVEAYDPCGPVWKNSSVTDHSDDATAP